MNVNKLFPRLTISAKLAIAFVLIATLPLVLVGVIGTVSAVRTLRSEAEAELSRDLELARYRAARGFRELQQHLAFLVSTGLEDLLEGGEAGDSAVLARLTESYLTSDPTALQRVKLIGADGSLRFVVQQAGAPLDQATDGEAGETFYALMAESLEPGNSLFLPIELRAHGGSATSGITPSVAALVPVYGAAGGYRGVVVGEASAELLFGDLDLASPGMEGVTGLVDQDGLFLYHSTRKRDWSRLLTERAHVTVSTDFSPRVAEVMLSSESGTLMAADGSVVGYRRVPLGSPDRFLVLYRAVPIAAVTASVRRYLTMFLGLGAGILVLVLGASTVAARQITRPVYALRHAASRIARGEEPGELALETNDEIEDLSRDFGAMADALQAHRTQLEALVEARTRELRSTRAELTQIVTHSADAIVGVDADGRIRFWSRGAEVLFGHAAGDVVGRNVEQVLAFPGERNVAEAAFLRRSVEKGDSVVNYRTKRMARDGQALAVSLTQSPILDERGALAGYSLILRDDRAQQNLDEQMRRSERLAAVSLMAAGLAHELNNPLAVLGNRIELMQRDAQKNGSERVRRDLEVLRQHVGRIGAITADLLRFARDDMDELGPLEPNQVADRVIRLVERMFVAAGLELRADLDPSVPPVQANRSAVETVLVNLLLNAQQATPRGGSVTISTRYSADEECVEVTVLDDGPGVPEEIRGRIFEPFFTTKADRGGTGLGLAVCRALMDRQGGRITLSPCNGRGSAFVLSFPVYVSME